MTALPVKAALYIIAVGDKEKPSYLHITFGVFFFSVDLIAVQHQLQKPQRKACGSATFAAFAFE